MSMITKYFKAVVDSPSHERSPGLARTTQHQLGSVVRQGGIGLLVGGGLGAIHASEGLDIKGRLPMDLMGAVGAGALASLFPSNEHIATNARDVMQSCVTTFSFRQGYALIAAKKKQTGGVPVGGFTPLVSGFHGENDFGTDDIGEDPIISMAKEFD